MAALCYAVLRLSVHFEGFEKYGPIGAFAVSFIGSASILFPVPSLAVIGAIAASPASNWAVVALASSAGGGLGEISGYLAGYGGAAVIDPSRSRWYRRAEGWMRRYGTLAVFIFAFTPLSFDIIGLVAGALRFPLWKFVLAAIAGRLPRTLIGCYLAHLGWELVQGLSWWGWLAIGLGIVLLAAAAALWWRRRVVG